MYTTTSTLTFANYWDHFLARWGVNRMGHRVEPGLYAIGTPAPESPVFVTANYSLSFDALRAALPGIGGYILALDTQAINVWCAAGKGTFGTDELVKRIETTGLRDLVTQRTVIVPQLGAPGIAAHQVKKQTGFKVEYGPVRASDLPEYLKRHEATPAMRRVQFTLLDRLAVIPIEIVGGLRWMLGAAVIAYCFGGWVSSLIAIAVMLAGVALFPILLPWLPTHDFSSKGFILGAAIALPLAFLAVQENADVVWWMRALEALAPLLVLPPVVAFLALNFTGSTTFTSRSGVQREIFKYVRGMAWMFILGLVLLLGLPLIRILGG